MYLFKVELNCKALFFKDLLFRFPSENRGQYYLFQKKIILTQVKTERFPSFRDKSGVCSLRPSAAVLREFLGCCFFLCFFPVAFFLLHLPFVPHSFFRRPLPSWAPLRRARVQGLLGRLYFSSCPPTPQHKCQGLQALLPPWPSSVCSLFCVQWYHVACTLSPCWSWESWCVYVPLGSWNEQQ